MASAPPGAEEQARKELHTALYNNPRIENLEEALKIAASVGIDMEPLVSEAKSTLLDLKEMRRFLAEALLLQFEGKLLEAGYTRILELSQMTTKDCRAVGFKGGHEKTLRNAIGPIQKDASVTPCWPCLSLLLFSARSSAPRTQAC